MKIIWKVFTVIISAAVLSSCGSNNKKGDETKSSDGKNEIKAPDSDPSSRLEGAWIIKRAEGDMAIMNEGTVYEFKESKLSFGKDGFLNPGKTEVTDTTFSFQADGNEYKFIYNYRFNGDTMVVTMQKGTGQVFYLVKK